MRNQKLFHANPAQPKPGSRWSREPTRPGNTDPLSSSHAFKSKEGQWPLQQSHPLRMGAIPAFCCLAHVILEDREWGLSAWQSWMRAAEHVRESQQRKGAGVSCISSERRTDLPTQRGQSSPWKQQVEMVHEDFSSETDTDISATLFRFLL